MLILSALCPCGISKNLSEREKSSCHYLPKFSEKAAINKIYIVLLNNRVIELSTKYLSLCVCFSSYPSLFRDDGSVFKLSYTNSHVTVRASISRGENRICQKYQMQKKLQIRCLCEATSLIRIFAVKSPVIVYGIQL